MIKRLVLLLALVSSFAAAQTTTTITGTVKDLTQAVVTSGKVTFSLTPARDTTISGLARFSPQVVTCLINASGLIKAQDGVGACVVTMNTALNPPGSYYAVAYWPYNVKTASFSFYAVLATYDWSTVVPTPTTSPAQNFVDIFSTQTVAGNKTFTGTNISSGNNTFSGANTFSSTNTHSGTETFSGTTNLASPTSTGTDTGTETLRNKTLQGANNNNAITLLNFQGPLSSQTGDATDKTVYTYTLPANSIGQGNGLRITVAWNHLVGTASITYKVFVGASSITAGANNITSTEQVSTVYFFNLPNQTAQNQFSSTLIAANTSGSAFLGSTTVDTTASQVVKFTFNVANTDQLTPRFMLVEAIQ